MEDNPKYDYVPQCVEYAQAAGLDEGEDFCKNKYCEKKSSGEHIIKEKKDGENFEFLVKCTGNCRTDRCYYCDIDGLKINKSKGNDPPECVYPL